MSEKRRKGEGLGMWGPVRGGGRWGERMRVQPFYSKFLSEKNTIIIELTNRNLLNLFFRLSLKTGTPLVLVHLEAFTTQL